MSKTPKRQRDANQLAKLIVDVATGEAELPENKPSGKNAAAVELGKKGGRQRSLSLTPEQRKEIAHLAANARWKKADD